MTKCSVDDYFKCVGMKHRGSIVVFVENLPMTTQVVKFEGGVRRCIMLEETSTRRCNDCDCRNLLLAGERDQDEGSRGVPHRVRRDRP